MCGLFSVVQVESLLRGLLGRVAAEVSASASNKPAGIFKESSSPVDFDLEQVISCKDILSIASLLSDRQ